MEGGSHADGAGSSKVKEYNWVVVGSERKHPVSYNASHGWLTVDGRHVELIRKRDGSVDDFRLPIDDAKAFFHTEGNYADVYVGGVSLNGVKPEEREETGNDGYYMLCAILNMLCFFTAQVYGMVLATLGLVICWHIRRSMAAPGQQKRRRQLSVGISIACLVITLIMLVWSMEGK